MTSTGSANDGLNDRIGVSFREMEKLLINCNNARIKAKNILSSRHRPEAYNLHNSFYEWEIHVCSICNHRVSNVHSTCFLHMTSLPKPTRLVTFIYFPPQLSHHASASRVFGAFFFALIYISDKTTPKWSPFKLYSLLCRMRGDEKAIRCYDYYEISAPRFSLFFL